MVFFLVYIKCHGQELQKFCWVKIEKNDVSRKIFEKLISNWNIEKPALFAFKILCFN